MPATPLVTSRSLLFHGLFDYVELEHPVRLPEDVDPGEFPSSEVASNRDRGPSVVGWNTTAALETHDDRGGRVPSTAHSFRPRTRRTQMGPAEPARP